MPRNRNKHADGRFFSLLVVLALIIFTGCSKKNQETDLVGYVGSKSGANGAILAAEQANSRKFGRNKALKIISIDASTIDFDADRAMESLRKDGVLVVIDGSGGLAEAKHQDGNVDIIATGPNQKALSTIADPLESAAWKMADQLWADRILSVSIVYDLADRSYNWKWINAFRSRYEKNRGVILKAETINSLQEGWEKELPGQVRKALIKEARCLVVVAETGAAGMIVQEARNFNKIIPLALAEQAFPAVLLGKAGNNLEGATMVNFPPSDGSGQSYERFSQDYRGRFGGRPANLTAASAYDAVGLIVAALGKDKRINKGLDALTEYQGVLGPAFHNSAVFARDAKLGRVINGQLAPIPSVATKKP